MISVKQFSKLSKADVAFAGGKGASLGELTQAGFPIPPGFVVTTQAHKKFINNQLPLDVEEEILKTFDKLDATRVAVRSSATAEDSSQASWAGQLETYLNVSKSDLINKVRECWKSIESERALAYAGKHNLSENKLFVAVVVQKMIESYASGVIFTVNPITKNKNEIMIEAGYGLGEMIVQGLITPNNFVIDKKTFQIKSRDIQPQEKMMVFKDGQNKKIPVPENKRGNQVIYDQIVKELAKMAVKTERHFGVPQDIEWAIDAKEKIWILQSRPITTL